VVSFIYQPLNTSVSIEQEAGWAQNKPGPFEGEENRLFPEIEPRLLGCPSRNLVTVSIKLSELPFIIIIIAERGGAVC